MGYSTEDCKKYLITVYKDTEEKGWKRVKKYNDEQQRIARDFQYKDGRVATILETPNGLIDKDLLNKTLSVKPDPKNNPFDKVRNKNNIDKNTNGVKNADQNFQDFMSKVLSGEPPKPDTTNNKSSIDMLKDFLKEQEERSNQPQTNDMFSLGSMPSIYMEAIQDNNGPLNPLVKSKENMVTLLLENVSYESLDTSEEKFLYILVNGTQWEEKEGNQASTDFYNVIKNNESFFDNLVKREIDLPNMYLLHVINTAVMIESMDEGYIPFHVMEGQEALKSMCEILEDIVHKYEKRNMTLEFDKEQVEGSLYTLESLKQLCSMNEAEDLWDKQDIDTEIDKLMSLIKSKSPKKRYEAMSIIVRQALSDSLYLLFKKNESKLLCQVPFSDKEGNPLPDEDVEYVSIIEVTKDLLSAGASAIYYVRDEEKFLLPAILSEMSYSSGFSEETKNEVTQILLDSLNEKELSGLIPAHSNMLIQQMLPYEEELNKLLMKGLNFQQDINNHYGSDAIEITAVKRANVGFFLKLAQNSVTLDFEKIYHEGSYNETSLIIEVNKLKEKISKFKLDSAEDNQVYETQKNENRKETVTLLEKWILKNKVESMNKSSKIKEGKLKL